MTVDAPNHHPPRRRRILVVDDEEALTDLLADLLEEEGYEVVCAYNGEQALRILESEAPPDLVLSDIMMPKLSGTELVSTVRAQQRRGRPPFVLLSAGAVPRITWDNVTFMPKPLHLDGLLAQVERMLEDRDDLAASA